MLYFNKSCVKQKKTVFKKFGLYDNCNHYSLIKNVSK